jgi:dsRNA-specific ribonuclease
VIPLRKPDDLSSWVERTFGYVFTTPALCHTAVTHRSAGAENKKEHKRENKEVKVKNC